jgi:hypothetical protein
MSHSESNTPTGLGPDQDLHPSRSDAVDVAPNMQRSHISVGSERQATSPSPPPAYAPLPPGGSGLSGVAGQGSYTYTQGHSSQPFYPHSHLSSSAGVFPGDPTLFLNIQPHPTNSCHHQHRHFAFHPYPNAHHLQAQTFGPTPISAMTTMTTLPLLPYAFYETPGAADARARWRFMGAVLVAVAVSIFVGFVVGWLGQ